MIDAHNVVDSVEREFLLKIRVPEGQHILMPFLWNSKTFLE